MATALPALSIRQDQRSDWLHSLAARLGSAFGVPFQLRNVDDEILLAPLPFGFDPSDLTQPTYVDADDGGYCLILPLQGPDGNRVLASATFQRPQRTDTAEIADDDPTVAALAELAAEIGAESSARPPCCDPKLLVRLASAITAQFEPPPTRRHDRQAAAYLGQLSATMEALTLLQRLVSDLELSEDLFALADKTIPNLRQQIKAVALGFIESRADVNNAAAAAIPDRRIAAWDGPRLLREPLSDHLLEHLRPQTPIVRNRLQDPIADRVESLVAVPVAKDRRLYGWLVALNRSDHGEFGSEEASLLASAAAILATHAYNVELFRERQSLLIGVVRALVAAIDAKDPYTCGHSERVALVAKRLGREVGLSDAQCEWLYLAGLLHDVGKIGVADELLQKPGKLTADEFNQVQRHVEMGYTILKDLNQLRDVLPGVRHHHESYDGTGYPDHLQGENIPKVARILAVADAYDAMRSDRPYRKGMPEEQVQTILQRGSGQQWDAAVVDALIRISQEIQRLTADRAPKFSSP